MVISSTEVRGIVKRACARSEVLDAYARRDLGAVITALGASGLTRDRISAPTGLGLPSRARRVLGVGASS